jgi:hypothetical protein
MNEEILKEGGAGDLLLPGKGTRTSANNVSTSEKKNICSPFMHCGRAQLSNAALRIDYEAFHEQHSVFIGMTDLNELVRSRFAPAAPVKETRIGPDGAETTTKIGYTCRTASGKALKINTIHSDGDLLLPWSNLQEIVNHKRNSAPVSRVRVPEAPRPAPRPLSVPASRDIREGLAQGWF